MRVKQMAGYAVMGIAGVVLASYVAAGVHDQLQMWDTAPAIDYGAPGTVYMKFNRSDKKPEGPLTIPQTGSEVVICFDDLTWMRPIAHDLKIWFLDENGRQDDYDDKITFHRIRASPKGPYPKKCRDQFIPGGMSPGPHILAGRAVPTDNRYRAAPIAFPEIKFVVQ